MDNLLGQISSKLGAKTSSLHVITDLKQVRLHVFHPSVQATVTC
jgi:hypothetical protein